MWPQPPAADAPPSYSEAVSSGSTQYSQSHTQYSQAHTQYSNTPTQYSYSQPSTQALHKDGSYPPPGSYPPGGQYPTTGAPTGGTNTVVIQQQPVVIHGIQRFTSRQAVVQCQHCQAQVTTTLEYESGTLTWVLCLVLAISMLFCGCCLIPFCMDQTKDVIHRCPNCKSQIGRFSRL